MLASQDYQGLRAAFAQMFAQLGRPKNARAPGIAEAPEALAPWIAHLVELDAMADLLPAAGIQLSYEELRGLALLREAQKKFLNEHESCPGCGQVRNRGGFCPRGCK